MLSRILTTALVTAVAALGELAGTAVAAPSPVATFPTAGASAGSASFNGTSSMVTVRRTARLDLSRGMTIEAWVLPSAKRAGRRDIIVKARNHGNFPYGLELTGGVPDAYATIGGKSLAASASSALALDTWSLVAASFDGRQLRLYVDGRQVGARSGSGTLSTSTLPLQIGGDSVRGRHFAGLIGNVRVYRQALRISYPRRRAAAPTNTVVPSITGSTVEGNTLTSTPGSWTGSPTSYAYQWQDCTSAGASCVNIAGATSRTYVLGARDVAHKMIVVVTARNASGTGAAWPNPTAMVKASGSAPTVTSVPAITGTTAQGDTLSVATGSWTGSPTSYAYQWQDCTATGGLPCNSIPGATSSTYTLQASDVGLTIDAVVTATNSSGSGRAYPAVTGVVSGGSGGGPPANTALPAISGTTAPGNTLSADSGSWSNSPTSYTYRWQDCDTSGASCANIAGATSAGYLLQAADAGHTMRVVVTATNASASANASSAPTGVVSSGSGPSPTYYMAQSAAGSGDGSSCANAKPASWFNTSSSWGTGAGRIAPGNTVGVCGTIASPLTAYGSGTSGNPITIVWLAGAKLSEPYCPGSGCFNTNNHAYLTLDGGPNGSIQATSNGTLLANHQGYTTGINALNCSGCTIKNLTIANLYVHYYNPSTNPSDPNGGGNALEVSGSNLTIANNTIHDVDNAIFAQFNATDSNIHISGNAISNINGGLLMAPNQTGGSIGPLYINNNSIQNFANWDDTSFNFHHDGIHCYTGAGAKDAHYNGVYIYNNTFGGVTDVNLADTDAMLILQSNNAGTECADATSPFYIFNNVASFTYAPGSALGYAYNGLFNLSSGKDYVYNNTLLGGRAANASTAFEAGGSGYSGGTGAVGMQFSNNALTTADQLMSVCLSSLEPCSGSASAIFAGGSPDYNVYAAGGANSFICGAASTFAFTAFGSWQPCIGADTHSLTTSNLQLSATGAPAPGSPVFGAGKNLTSLCTGALVPLCSDIAGNPRPTTGSWSAGAYE